jgi:hypothetical protein
MPDFGPAAVALLDILGPHAKKAVGVALRTTAGVALLSVAVSGSSFLIAFDGSWWRGLLGAAVGLGCCAVIGAILVAKRSVLSALIVGVGKLGLGKKAMGLLFDSLLAISEHEPQGERGIAVAETAEGMPLAAAQDLLQRASARLVGPDGGGYFNRALRSRLIALVKTVTLAKFRDDASTYGGVNLVLVRDELTVSIDELLSRQLEELMSRVTLWLVLSAIGASTIVAMVLRWSR